MGINLPSSLPELGEDQMGTAKEKRGRKVKGRLLAETGGLCPSLEHGCFRGRGNCRKELVQEQLSEREGTLPLYFLPSVRYAPALDFFFFFLNTLNFGDLSV